VQIYIFFLFCLTRTKKFKGFLRNLPDNKLRDSPTNQVVSMPKIFTFLRIEAIRNFSKVFFSSMAAQAISLVLAPVLSRLFGPGDFGLAGIYLGIVGLLSVLSTGKYEQAIMLPKRDGDAVSIFWLVMHISLAISLLIALVVIPFHTPLARLANNEALGPWLLLLPVSLMLHGLYQGAVFYANRQKKFGLMGGGTLVQYGALNTFRILSGWAKAPFNGLIAGHLAAQFAAATYVFRGVAGKLLAAGSMPSASSMREQAKAYIQYPRFNMALSFTNNLSGSLPVFMFTWGFSPEMAGLYAFGYAFVFRPLSLFSQSTSQVLSQKIIEDYHQGREVYATLRKLAWRFFLTGLPAFSILAFWAPALFGFIFSDDYVQAGTFLQILSPYLLMVFIASPLSFVPELFFRQKKAMVIDFIYLALRFMALWTGIRAGDLTMALVLFSAVSTLVVTYNLFWYLSLARKHG
jgi:O-antigen/teichoic acid export membrane protein